VTAMPTPPARPGRKPNARANPKPDAGPRAQASAATARKASAKATGKTAAVTSARARKSTPAATGQSTQARSGRSPQAGAAAGAHAPTRPATRRAAGLPRTLSFDIGGTGLKASVLSKHGELLHEPVRIPTPYPLRPEQLVAVLGQMATGLPSYERVSAGFPGMVREGRVLSAPHFVCTAGDGSKSSVELEKAWSGFELQQALATALGRPCRVANDADVQGAAIVKGEGLEFVVTLGTGVGTALFWQGKLAPHLELAQHPLSKRGKTYNEVLGEAARKKDGSSKWNDRVLATIEILKGLVFYDHCYIGGGNSTKVKFSLPPDVTLADNSAGIIGGIKLWERT
jgi:polyphosphate glucokinase